jgi:hypothetical protein
MADPLLRKYNHRFAWSVAFTPYGLCLFFSVRTCFHDLVLLPGAAAPRLAGYTSAHIGSRCVQVGPQRRNPEREIGSDDAHGPLLSFSVCISLKNVECTAECGCVGSPQCSTSIPFVSLQSALWLYTPPVATGHTTLHADLNTFRFSGEWTSRCVHICIRYRLGKASGRSHCNLLLSAAFSHVLCTFLEHAGHTRCGSGRLNPLLLCGCRVFAGTCFGQSACTHAHHTTLNFTRVAQDLSTSCVLQPFLPVCAGQRLAGRLHTPNVGSSGTAFCFAGFMLYPNAAQQRLYTPMFRVLHFCFHF